MNEAVIIVAIISTISFIGMGCLLVDIFTTKPKFIPKPVIKQKPTIDTNDDVMIDESLYDFE